MASLAIDLTHELRAFTLALKLEVGPEVVALVGPSGAGKTTVLRCVAGLTRPDVGSVRSGAGVWLDRAAGIDIEPQRRSVGYVPQHHALFPHLTVAQNVAFGGAGAADVDRLLARLRIVSLADQRPDALSGGERQRVALARALARDPEVLLLDEPLAALDADTRRVVRDELADELTALGIPTLLVTHDFTDAAALAERVAVMVDGTLRQAGPPEELLEAPADAFVVSLTGGFVLAGTARGGTATLNAGGELPVDVRAEGRVLVGVHPWAVEVRPGPGARGGLRGVVRGLTAEGARSRVRTEAWSGEARSDLGLRVGDEVHGVVHRAVIVPPLGGRGS